MQATFETATKPSVILCDCLFTLFDAARSNKALIDELVQSKASGSQVFLIAKAASALNDSWQIEMALEKAGYAADALSVDGKKAFDHKEIEKVLSDKGITAIDVIYTAGKHDIAKTMPVGKYNSPKANWDHTEVLQAEPSMQPA